MCGVHLDVLIFDCFPVCWFIFARLTEALYDKVTVMTEELLEITCGTLYCLMTHQYCCQLLLAA